MLKRIWAKLRVYFYYNQTERNGVLIFAFILLFFYIGFWIYTSQTIKSVNSTYFFAQVDSIEKALKNSPQEKITYFSFNPNTVNETDLQKLGFSEKQTRNLLNYRKAGGKFYKKEDFQKLYFVNDSIYAIYEAYIAIPQKKKSAKKEVEPAKKNLKKEIRLFEFNPNEITKEQWRQLGISPRIANIIGNYLQKGGRFTKAEDLKKIYGFSDEDFQRLAPYVKIPKEKKKEEEIIVFDINTATARDFEAIKIRERIAERIVKFREKLGGFAQMSQLSEVYGIKKFELVLLKKHCKIQQPVQQININTASSKELRKHLYLSFSDAQAIVRYRERNGDYENVENLREAKILTDTVFGKVKFYLKVRN